MKTSVRKARDPPTPSQQEMTPMRPHMARGAHMRPGAQNTLIVCIYERLGEHMGNGMPQYQARLGKGGVFVSQLCNQKTLVFGHGV